MTYQGLTAKKEQNRGPQGGLVDSQGENVTTGLHCPCSHQVCPSSREEGRLG